MSGDSSEDGPVDLPKGKLVAKRFLILEKLGEGGCGSVYKVEDLETRKKHAMKAESNAASGGAVLKLEVAVLKKLQGARHFADLIHAGKRGKYSYMVMTLFGPSLSGLMRKTHKHSFSVSTMTRVGIQLLFCIKQLHDAGFIHRDIKPSNLAIGRHYPESRFIFLLDFGLSREYIVREENKVMMRRPRHNTLFRGTTKYCSISTHDRNEQGRPDDLWSMLYMMVEMRGSLPWEDMKDKKEIGQMKKKITDHELLVNCPVQMLKVAQHLRSLSYYARPDYLFIYRKLMDVMNEGKFKFTDPYDWERSLSRNVTKKLSKMMPTQSTQDSFSLELRKDPASPHFNEDEFSSNLLGF